MGEGGGDRESLSRRNFFSLSNTPYANMADLSAGPGLGARK